MGKKIITPPSEIQAYFDSPAINQSLLKTLIQGPGAFQAALGTPSKELYYEEKGHFVIGSGVDTILTQGREVFKELYHVENSMSKKPSDTIMSIVQMAFNNFVEADPSNETLITEQGFSLSEHWNAALHIALGNHSYYDNEAKPTWQADGRLNRLIKGGANDYFHALLEGYGKQIISGNEGMVIESIVKSLKENDRTAICFMDEDQLPEDIDIYHQVALYFDHLDVPCKILIDILLVNHARKFIFPIDAKTLGQETVNFPIQVRARRYDFQGSFYTTGIEKALFERFPELKGYIIQPFRFVAETTMVGKQGSPLVFACTPELLAIGRQGRPELYYQAFGEFKAVDAAESMPDVPYTMVIAEIKGFEQLLDDYKWYEENGWKERRKVVENGGFLEIGWHGIL